MLSFGRVRNVFPEVDAMPDLSRGVPWAVFGACAVKMGDGKGSGQREEGRQMKAKEIAAAGPKAEELSAALML